MTIKDMREILVHFTDHEYDDYEVELFDFNNQRKLEWLEGCHSFSKPEKRITFPVRVEPVDGETIDKRLERMIKSVQNSSKNDKE